MGRNAWPDAKRLKELEAENTRLKLLLPEQAFESSRSKDALRKFGEYANKQHYRQFPGTRPQFGHGIAWQNKRARQRSLTLCFYWCRKWDSNPHAFKGGGF